MASTTAISSSVKPRAGLPAGLQAVWLREGVEMVIGIGGWGGIVVIHVLIFCIFQVPRWIVVGIGARHATQRGAGHEEQRGSTVAGDTEGCATTGWSRSETVGAGAVIGHAIPSVGDEPRRPTCCCGQRVTPTPVNWLRSY